MNSQTKLKKHVTQLSKEEKQIIDKDLILSEIEIALKQMKNEKSPGIDGISIEVFKTFWRKVKHLLYNAYKDCIKMNNYPEQ